jgi:phage FluMu gp28-like protein
MLKILDIFLKYQ